MSGAELICRNELEAVKYRKSKFTGNTIFEKHSFNLSTNLKIKVLCFVQFFDINEFLWLSVTYV